MKHGRWGQPSAIYSLCHASFQKGLLDAYQRRLGPENNGTKTLEEKKKSKGSTLRQTCLLGSELLSRWGQKGKWATKASQWEKKWSHTIVTREARFPDSKLVTVTAGWGSVGSCSVPGMGPRALSDGPQTALWGRCYFTILFCKQEMKAHSEQFLQSSQCFQKAELGCESRSPDSRPPLA